MATTPKSHHDPSFFLPTHFLTDDDFLLPSHSTLLSPELSYPFPDDVFLTRQLPHSTLLQTRSSPTQKQPLLFSTSPQSTLPGFGPFLNRTGSLSDGSPNGPSRVPSPSVTPPGANKDAGWDLLYEAAAQVARLKMNAIVLAQMNHNRGRFLEARRNPNPSLLTKSNGFYDFSNINQGLKRQGRQETENWHRPHHHHPRRSSGGEALGLPKSAWPPLGGGLKETGMETMVIGGDTGMKRQSAGTGVFLPRRPGTQQPFPAEPRRKSTGGSPVSFPATVVEAQNLNLDEINPGANPNSQSRFGRRLAFHHEMMASRRKSSVEDERRPATMAVHHEVCLPSDWTY